jgi:hypothetical protein
MSVQGVKAIKAAVLAHQRASIKGLRKGLYRAGLFLQRESQKIVPIDTSTLKGSANTRIEGVGLDSTAIISYGTDYAIYVHENLEAKHKSGKCAKFLEKPLREKHDRLVEIISEGIKEGAG